MDSKLIDILVCPVCHGPLVYKKDAGQKQVIELICKVDRLAFPVTDDIPVLLESDARELSPEEEV